MKEYIGPSQQRLFPLVGARACTPICICFANLMLDMTPGVRQIFVFDDTDPYANQYFYELKTTQEMVTSCSNPRQYCCEVMTTAIRQGVANTPLTQCLSRKSMLDCQNLICQFRLTYPDPNGNATTYRADIPTHTSFATAIAEQITGCETQPFPTALFITANGHTVVLINFEHHLFFFDSKTSFFSLESSLKIYYRQYNEIPDLVVQNICSRLGTTTPAADFYLYTKNLRPQQ